MVGTDGSESSFRAVARAAEVAAGATLLPVSVHRPMPERAQRRLADQLGEDAYKVAGSHPADHVLSTAKDTATAAGANKIKTPAIEGDAVDELIKAATEHEADLVVVGNRGLDSLSGRLPESVPAHVSRRSSVGVPIVATTGR